MNRNIRRIGTAAVLAVVALLSVIVAPTAAEAASAPTTSPSAHTRVFYTDFDSISCPVRNACATVPYGNGWYVFGFYYYGTYHLSNFFGAGLADNNQTGGASMSLYTSSGLLECVQFEDGVNWNPINQIRVTSGSC